MRHEWAEGGQALFGAQSKMLPKLTASLVGCQNHCAASGQTQLPAGIACLASGQTLSPVPGKSSSMPSTSDSLRNEVRACPASAHTAPVLRGLSMHRMASQGPALWRSFPRCQSTPPGIALCLFFHKMDNSTQFEFEFPHYLMFSDSKCKLVAHHCWPAGPQTPGPLPGCSAA